MVKLSQLSMISVDCEGTECIPGAREGQGVAQSKEAGAEEHNFFIARLGLSEQEWSPAWAHIPGDSVAVLV